MSTTLPFDTLAFSKKLKDGGVPSAQAETHAAALSETLEQLDERVATKQDLAGVTAQITKTETHLRHNIKETKLHLIIFLGSLLAAGLTILGILIKF